MSRLRLRPQAENDLEEIWWFIAQDDAETADAFLDRIQEKCRALAQFSNLGVARDELMPSLRSFPIGNYLIFYFPIEDGIEVVRVLHGARDLDSLLDTLSVRPDR